MPSSRTDCSLPPTVLFPVPCLILTLASDDGTPLYNQMIGSYRDSIAPGTAANRLTQAKTYLTFATLYNFDPLCPSSTSLCMYVQFLKNSFSAPTTIKNYLSGARTWLAEHGGTPSAFSTFEYHQMSVGLSKRSQHVPQRAPPLTWEHIKKIVRFLDSTPRIPAAVKPCLLIGFHTFLRSGNLLSPTVSAWGGSHTLSARDICLSDEGITVFIHSTKTKSDPKPVSTLIQWQEDPQLCPAAAWLKYVTAINPWTLGPAFLTDDRRPLTPKVVVGLMRLALAENTDIDSARISMHSIRRGAAQNAELTGLSLPHIKERGMWRSDSGLAPYLL